MAVTGTPASGNFPTHVVGNRKEWLGTITFDSSYVTGGEPLTASDFGMANIEFVGVGGLSLAGRGVTYVSATKLLKVYVTSTDTEVANGVDLSADSVQARVVGT
jgi:hypothetical protein